MRFPDLLIMSVNNLRRRKRRTALTVLGVIIEMCIRDRCTLRQRPWAEKSHGASRTPRRETPLPTRPSGSFWHKKRAGRESARPPRSPMPWSKNPAEPRARTARPYPPASTPNTALPLSLIHIYRRMEHIVWDVHQPEKDETDTELALQKAQAIGSGEIAVLGATGGRIDHMLGNIHLLFPCLQKGIHAWLADPQNRIYLIDGEHEFKRSALWGKYISFLPLTEQVNGITLEGFKYPLFEKDIEIGTSLCISCLLYTSRCV